MKFGAPSHRIDLRDFDRSHNVVYGSRINGNLFCYTAITSSSIIGILPGYLILSSSLELASKKIVCGSVRMVYSLMYTLFLGFGLQIGSEIFLVMNVPYRYRLERLSNDISGTVTMLASLLIDNSTIGNGQASMGIYQFTDTALGIRKYVVNGCYRPHGICNQLHFGPSSSSSPPSPLYPRWRISNHTEARKMLSTSL